MGDWAYKQYINKLEKENTKLKAEIDRLKAIPQSIIDKIRDLDMLSSLDKDDIPLCNDWYVKRDEVIEIINNKTKESE